MRGLFRAENGKASKKIIECVKTDLSNHFGADSPADSKSIWLMEIWPKERVEYFFYRFYGKPDELFNEMFNTPLPARVYGWYLYSINKCPGVEDLDSLFTEAVFEIFKANPFGVFELFVSNFLDISGAIPLN